MEWSGCRSGCCVVLCQGWRLHPLLEFSLGLAAVAAAFCECRYFSPLHWQQQLQQDQEEGEEGAYSFTHSLLLPPSSFPSPLPLPLASPVVQALAHSFLLIYPLTPPLFLASTPPQHTHHHHLYLASPHSCTARALRGACTGWLRGCCSRA